MIRKYPAPTVVALFAFGTSLALFGFLFLVMGLCPACEGFPLLVEWRRYPNYQLFMQAAVELILTGLLLCGTGILLRTRSDRWALIVGAIALLAACLTFNLVGQIVSSMRADGLL